MGVLRSDPSHATIIMLRVYDGMLSYYQTLVIMPNIYDRWLKLNVIHDFEASKVQVYIDGVLIYEGIGRRGFRDLITSSGECMPKMMILTTRNHIGRKLGFLKM